jgi:hypothetical protein
MRVDLGETPVRGGEVRRRRCKAHVLRTQADGLRRDADKAPHPGRKTTDSYLQEPSLEPHGATHG